MRPSAMILAVAIFVLPMHRGAAEVVSSAANGFTVHTEIEVDGQIDGAWRMLTVHIGEWWDGAHTFSGEARNLYLETRPNGCFCEKLGDEGSVVHMTVTFVDPGRMLRLTGALGPLGLRGVAGNMTWSFGEAEGRTRIALHYAVGGYDPEGLDKLAPAVDRVLTEQLLRLQRLIQTGDPAGET
ncbi:MAG: ATPase [Gammaproteobacteria bacterium]|jgi:hypothetical protein